MNMFLKILIVKEVHLYAALPASIGSILLIITVPYMQILV